MFLKVCHGWETVGLPDTSIRESKERVRTAIKNSGFELRSSKIIVNLAPAEIKKEGPYFDLPIAVGILLSMETIKPQKLEDTIFIGELSLDGKLMKVNGILPLCIEAKKLNIKRIILPKENVKEATIVKGIEVIGINDLKEIVMYLNEEIEIIEEDYTRPLYEMLETQYNIVVKTSKEEISARLAGEFIAEKLEIKSNDPILIRRRFVYDVNGVPIEYNVGYYRADSFTYTIEAER